ncbi:MAG: phosphatase PAP2 family protein [Acidimicrobiales bacterium]
MFEEVGRLDHAIYDAVSRTPTPTLDVPMRRLSKVANYARVWVAVAAALAALGGQKGRRAAILGLKAVGAASISANLVAKHLIPRNRPVRRSPVGVRETYMPTSSSFPSGHAATGFAFAAAVTGVLPQLALPLYGLAALIGYSRIHTGVHYPTDVVGGAFLGLAIGREVRRTLPRPTTT